MAGREPTIQSLYLWAKSILPNYTLFAERLEMAYAVEARLPFLDHKVFELVRDMPVSLLIRGATEKYVLREAVRSYLTDGVYSRPKHPFFAPPITFGKSDPINSLIQDSLRGSLLTSVPFFDRAAVIALLDKLPDMKEAVRVSLEQVLQIILCTCLLKERYGL
jgi:asparagine synthase (glutamine-hydrolysing)